MAYNSYILFLFYDGILNGIAIFPSLAKIFDIKILHPNSN